MPSEPDAPSSIGRVPPHNDDAEKGIIGSILLDASRVLDLTIERGITPESFYVPNHRTIYECCIELSKRGSAVDSITLCALLEQKNELERIGGAAAIDQIIDVTPTSAHAEYYSDIVRDTSVMRSIIKCARDAEARCYEPEESAEKLLDLTEQSFLDITENQRKSVITWADSVNTVMGHVEDVFTSKKGIAGISTGFANLDRKLLGMKGGELLILAARPSMGKTSLAMNIAENVALGKLSEGPVAVGVFSLEMSQDSLVLRMLCSHAGVSSFELNRGYLGKENHASLTRSASILRKAPILLDDTGGLDVMEVRARGRRMKLKHDVKFIVIDYLQLMHSKEHARQGVQVETAAISGQLKSMAKELDVPVFVLSQLSRAPETRDKLGKPKMSDLRDSGAIEQDADVIMLLRRPCKYPDDENAADEMLSVVDVAKQRNGPTGEVYLNFEESFTRFRDRAQQGVDGLPEFEPDEAADEMEIQ